MEVLLLTDIAGVGKKNDLIVVKSGFALNFLLPERKAMVVTPSVRKRYAEQIKDRALQREREREIQVSLNAALSGKVVHLMAKAGKTGKLYAAVSEAMIADALKKEYGIDIPASTITLKEHIKTVGAHPVTIAIGSQSAKINVEVKAEAPVKIAA